MDQYNTKPIIPIFTGFYVIDQRCFWKKASRRTIKVHLPTSTIEGERTSNPILVDSKSSMYAKLLIAEHFQVPTEQIQT